MLACFRAHFCGRCARNVRCVDPFFPPMKHAVQENTDVVFFALILNEANENSIPVKS